MAPKRGTVKHRSPLPHGIKNTPERRALFLEQLALGRSPTAACVAADLGYTTVHEWRKCHPEFAEQWAVAVEQGVDLLEDECRRRAYDGYDRPVYQGKELVGTVREYSDTLMVLMLKGRRKQVFSERTEHVGADGGAVKHEIEVTFVKAEKREIA